MKKILKGLLITGVAVCLGVGIFGTVYGFNKKAHGWFDQETAQLTADVRVNFTYETGAFTKTKDSANPSMQFKVQVLRDGAEDVKTPVFITSDASHIDALKKTDFAAYSLNLSNTSTTVQVLDAEKEGVKKTCVYSGAVYTIDLEGVDKANWSGYITLKAYQLPGYKLAGYRNINLVTGEEAATSKSTDSSTPASSEAPAGANLDTEVMSWGTLKLTSGATTCSLSKVITVYADSGCTKENPDGMFSWSFTTTGAHGGTFSIAADEAHTVTPIPESLSGDGIVGCAKTGATLTISGKDCVTADFTGTILLGLFAAQTSINSIMIELQSAN
jgi:hypothetical protein